MSLINQALRKAQRDRTPNRMTEAGASTPAQVAAAGANGMKPGLVIGLVITVALLVGLVAGLSLVLFSGTEPAPATVAQQQEIVPPTPAAASPAATSPAVEPAKPTPAPAPAPVEPIAQQTAPAQEALPLQRETNPPVVEELRKAREAAETKAAAEAKAAEEATARAAAKPSQDIIDWLARAVISGVKLSDAESKVILNGDSYAVGEYVNFGLGLKVLIIQEKRVLFIDENEKKYMKRL